MAYVEGGAGEGWVSPSSTESRDSKAAWCGYAPYTGGGAGLGSRAGRRSTRGPWDGLANGAEKRAGPGLLGVLGIYRSRIKKKFQHVQKFKNVNNHTNFDNYTHISKLTRFDEIGQFYKLITSETKIQTD